MVLSGCWKLWMLSSWSIWGGQRTLVVAAVQHLESHNLQTGDLDNC